MKRLKHIKFKMFLATICSVINKLADLGQPIVIGIIIDMVTSKQDSFVVSLGFNTLIGQLILMSIIIIFLYGIESLSDFASNVMWRNISQILQHKLRFETYAHAQALDLKYYENHKIGNVANIINNDINQLQVFLDSGFHQIIQLFTNFLVVVIIYAISIKSLVWLIFLPMPFIVLLSKKYQKIVEPKYSRVRENSAAINAQLFNNFDGISTIKSYVTEEVELSRIEKLSKDYLFNNKKAIICSSAYIPIIRMIIAVGYIIVLITSGSMVLSNHMPLSVFATLMYMSERIFWPLVSAGHLFDAYQQAKACVRRISQVLSAKRTILDGVNDSCTCNVLGSITFKNISFQYNTDKPVLKNINLNINKGNMIGIIGATGSGKSTLVKLLLRFYDSTSGEIYLDNVNITSFKLKDLRRAIAYISQDLFIFPGSIKENISYGSDTSREEDIINAAKIAEAHNFIMKQPEGYDTRIGEKGLKLSGGQRQRISIARAVLKNAPIIVLDEATSALDNETELSVQISISKLCKEKTIILIAHRLSTVRNADNIIVLENGEIVEEGTHEELLTNNQVYAKQWRIQTGVIHL
jgi:ATP-binding cassette subfamily B protein